MLRSLAEQITARITLSTIAAVILRQNMFKDIMAKCATCITCARCITQQMKLIFKGTIYWMWYTFNIIFITFILVELFIGFQLLYELVYGYSILSFITFYMYMFAC